MSDTLMQWLKELDGALLYTILCIEETEESLVTSGIIDDVTSSESSDELNDVLWENDDTPIFHIGWDVMQIGHGEVRNPNAFELDFIKENLEEVKEHSYCFAAGIFRVLNQYYDDL